MEQWPWRPGVKPKHQLHRVTLVGKGCEASSRQVSLRSLMKPAVMMVTIVWAGHWVGPMAQAFLGDLFLAQTTLGRCVFSVVGREMAAESVGSPEKVELMVS